MADIERLRQLAKQGMTLQAMGDEFGVTRERVRQLLQSYEIPYEGKRRRCTACKKRLPRRNKTGYHRQCNRVTVTCGTCGIEFSLTRKDYNNRHRITKVRTSERRTPLFHSMRCYGLWAVRNHILGKRGLGKKEALQVRPSI